MHTEYVTFVFMVFAGFIAIMIPISNLPVFLVLGGSLKKVVQLFTTNESKDLSADLETEV